MSVQEFVEAVGNAAFAADVAPGYYMRLFLSILDEFRDERCCVLRDKVKARMSDGFKKRAAVMGWDDVVVQDQGIARVGFVQRLPDGTPMIIGWSFDSTEYGREKGVSYTPRELQRISEAYWKDKSLPKLDFIGETRGS